MPLDRRRFLTNGIFSLAAVTAGAIALTGCGSEAAGDAVRSSSAADDSAPPTGPGSAGFGWTLTGPPVSRAYAYFEIAKGLTIQSLDINTSIASSTMDSTGLAQAACRGWISRRSLPAFVNHSASAAPMAESADFGRVLLYNPGGISATYDRAPNSDVFYSAVLKSWVPAVGTGIAGTHRFAGFAALTLEAGDYLVLEIVQSGLASAVGMQAVLNYT